jgi:hypothetical protein
LGSWAAGWAWFSRNGFRWHDGLVMLDLILPASPFGIEDLGRYHRADLVVASILVGTGWLLSLALLPGHHPLLTPVFPVDHGPRVVKRRGERPQPP